MARMALFFLMFLSACGSVTPAKKVGATGASGPTKQPTDVGSSGPSAPASPTITVKVFAGVPAQRFSVAFAAFKTSAWQPLTLVSPADAEPLVYTFIATTPNYQVLLGCERTDAGTTRIGHRRQFTTAKVEVEIHCASVAPKATRTVQAAVQVNGRLSGVSLSSTADLQPLVCGTGACSDSTVALRVPAEGPYDLMLSTRSGARHDLAILRDQDGNEGYSTSVAANVASTDFTFRFSETQPLPTASNLLARVGTNKGLLSGYTDQRDSSMLTGQVFTFAAVHVMPAGQLIGTDMHEITAGFAGDLVANRSPTWSARLVVNGVMPTAPIAAVLPRTPTGAFNLGVDLDKLRPRVDAINLDGERLSRLRLDAYHAPTAESWQWQVEVDPATLASGSTSYHIEMENGEWVDVPNFSRAFFFRSDVSVTATLTKEFATGLDNIGGELSAAVQTVLML